MDITDEVEFDHTIKMGTAEYIQVHIMNGSDFSKEGLSRIISAMGLMGYQFTGCDDWNYYYDFMFDSVLPESSQLSDHDIEYYLKRMEFEVEIERYTV